MNDCVKSVVEGESAFCVSVRATPQAVRAKLVSILCSENILDKAFAILENYYLTDNNKGWVNNVRR